MRAGPTLDDIGKWDEIKPLIDYGKNGRFNMRSVKLFMDGRFENLYHSLVLTVHRCLGILGCLFAGTILGQQLNFRVANNGTRSDARENQTVVAARLASCTYRYGDVTFEFTHLRYQNVHVIGDRANHIVLNVFEEIQSKEPEFTAKNRPRLEHAQILTLGDLERTGRLGGEGF